MRQFVRVFIQIIYFIFIYLIIFSYFHFSFTVNTDGGVCSAYSRAQTGATLNTGIVTLNNYGSFVPPTVSHLTFAHELGHTFGSAVSVIGLFHLKTTPPM